MASWTVKESDPYSSLEYRCCMSSPSKSRELGPARRRTQERETLVKEVSILPRSVSSSKQGSVSELEAGEGCGPSKAGLVERTECDPSGVLVNAISAEASPEFLAVRAVELL